MSLFDKIIGNKSDSPPQIETEPIVGFRCWKFRESPEGVPLLYSRVQDFCWPPFEAAKGDIDGGDGIYAYKSRSDAWAYHESDTISGEVFLWGGVMEHSEGYRAECAYPKELWVSTDFDAAMVLRLEESYGVPVVMKEDLPEPTAEPVTNFRAGSGIASGLMECVVDTIYDRETICGSNVHLFALPLGQMSYGVDSVPLVKSYDRTNMLISGMLPPPQRFLVKSIRCAFFEADGRVVPVTDPIYWESTLALSLQMKQYWHSPVAHIADPAVLLAVTDWSKIPNDERLQLLDRLRSGSSLVSGPTHFSNSAIPRIDGVMIEQQMRFQVRITGAEKWRKRREIMCALEGISGRAIF